MEKSSLIFRLRRYMLTYISSTVGIWNRSLRPFGDTFHLRTTAKSGATLMRAVILFSYSVYIFVYSSGHPEVPTSVRLTEVSCHIYFHTSLLTFIVVLFLTGSYY